MKLLVIVVVYNGIKWLDKCLSSVRNSNTPADLFVVDNGSTDNSIQYIQQNYSESNFIISKSNLGFGQANNLGLKYAIENKYDFVYLLNQDAWVKPDTFEKLIVASYQNPQFGILSPLQVNGNETLLDYNFYHYCCPRTLSSASLLRHSFKTIYETDFVMAAHWLISTKCLATVGIFSPTFFHYGEDNNYIDRLKFHNFKVGIVPTCIGVHDREERPTSNEKKIYMYYIDKLIQLSNPCNKQSSTKIYRALFMMGVRCREFSYIKKLFLLIRSRKDIIRNKQISQKEGAFL